MTYSSLVVEQHEGVTVVELNRPAFLNSFTRQMALELQEVLAECGANEAIRAVLLTGKGRGFCGGQDLADLGPLDDPALDLGAIVRTCYNPVVLGIRALEKPVICAVNGVAAGAGANLALACDIVVASREASFIQSFSNVGLIPDTGGSYFLPRIVGHARATALMMLGEKVSAEEAVRLGMIYQVFEPDVLRSEAMGLATRLAAAPTRGLGLTKRALNASVTSSLEEQLHLEAELQHEVGCSADFREGVTAFLQKRKPAFTGR